MATAVFSFKRLDDGSILIHAVVSPRQTTADKHLAEHAGICPAYGPAFRAGETVEFAREVDYVPHFSGDDLEAWLNELLASEVDEAEDEPIDMVPE